MMIMMMDGDGNSDVGCGGRECSTPSTLFDLADVGLETVAAEEHGEEELGHVHLHLRVHAAFAFLFVVSSIPGRARGDPFKV